MARKEKKYHFIYKTTNLKNGKFYVGMHSTDNLNDGYLGSGLRLRRSIRKNGPENFKIEYLEFFDNRIDLANREKELISETLLKDPMCLNIRSGGTGGWTSEQQKQNAHKSNERQRWLMENNKEWAEKRLISRKKNGSNVFKKLWVENKLKPLDWTGRKHSSETIEKMKLLKKDFGIGSNNSQYGTKWAWVSKNNEVKKIKLDFLEDFIKDGWVRGIKK